MLKKLYFSGGDQFFQISPEINSLYEWGGKHLFIGWEDIIWDWGDNFSKFIDRGSHRGTSHRGTWTGCTRQGKTTNFKNKNTKLSHSKYFLLAYFFTARILHYYANKSLKLISRKVPIWRFE